MELRDLLVAPIIITMVIVAGYIIRPYVTDDVNRVYFIPALWLKIAGALLLGVLYQFYYHGGDTYNYHTHGSRHIWEAFVESPQKGFQLLTANGEFEHGTYKYANKMPFYQDASSYAVIRLAGFFDLFTFSSYAGTAVLFSVLGFVGGWLFFLAFYEDHPHLHRWIAIAILFVPSVIIWGSGLMKDTVTLGGLGAMTYCVKRLFIQRRIKLSFILLLLVSFYLVFFIKKYMLMCFVPAVLVWVFAGTLQSIRSVVFRILLFPFFLGLIAVFGYMAVIGIGKDDKRYSVDNIAKTAMVTAYDIGFYTGRDAGSTYSLGELDGSFSGLLTMAPQAINVSLFRPYLWEVRNPLMLFSAIESFAFLLLTVVIIFKARASLDTAILKPEVLFCLLFSVTFAFAVGVSTFNFGTLSRYKIPLMPFYLLALIIINDQSNKDKKLGVFDETE